MAQKIFFNTVFVSLIIILTGTVGYFAFNKQKVEPTPSVSSNLTEVTPPIVEQAPVINNELASTTSSSQVTVTDRGISLNIKGYFVMCELFSTLYKKVNNSWEKVLTDTDLPQKGLYYLDSEFVGYGMCDSHFCTELPSPLTNRLVTYKNVGSKAPPKNSGSSALTVPVYTTSPLTGEIKIDVNYYSDKDCQNKKTFSTVIKK